MESFGAVLRHLRQAQGLTQADVAGRHLTRAHISAVERGASRLSIDGLKYLIATLHQPDVLVQAYCTAYPPEPSWIELVRFLVLRGHRDLAESVVRIAQGTLRSRPGSAVESLRLAFDGWSLKLRDRAAAAALHLSRAAGVALRARRWYEGAVSLWHSGEALVETGQFVRAISHFRRARVLLGSRQSRRALTMLGHLWRSEGAVFQRLGLHGRSRACLLQARQMYGEAGHSVEEGHALIELSLALLGEGKPAEAKAVLCEAGSILHRAGHQTCWPILTLNLGIALAEMGHHRESLPLLTEARSVPELKTAAYAALELARLHACQGQPDKLGRPSKTPSARVTPWNRLVGWPCKALWGRVPGPKPI